MKTIHALTKMKYNLRSVTLAALFVLLIGSGSCDSFVEVELPKSQLTNTVIFEDYATANAAMSDVFSKIRDRGLLTGAPYGLSNQLGCYTDEIIFYGSAANPTFDFYTNAVLPSNSTVALFWNNSYNQIYAANAVIAGVRGSTKLSESNKALLEGEALFVRALLHFYLVNLFDSVPYVTTTDYRENSQLTRTPVKEVYQQIISDLEASSILLPENYNNTARVRPNKSAVKALLARVYLYNESWELAANAASAVLNSTNLYLLKDNLNTVFLKESTETIWQFMPSATGKNTDEASTFIFFAGPPPLVGLNVSLINSFTPQDLRKALWTKTITKTSSTWYHSNKYKEFNYTTPSKEYSIVLRLAEQYLIRAEARAQQGDLIGAKEDLYKIRQRAGLSQTTAVTKEEILQEILKERRLELFTEYGHRFFDLKRNGQLDAALSLLKPGWSNKDRLFPIPESELSVNPNLRPQNEGY